MVITSLRTLCEGHGSQWTEKVVLKPVIMVGAEKMLKDTCNKPEIPAVTSKDGS